MGDKMLVYGVPESLWGQYFEYGVLTGYRRIRIIKTRSVYENLWDVGDNLIISDYDIIKIGGMVE